MGEVIGVFVAWPYPNGNLHLGHVAGAYLPADIFARYHRLRGNQVLMVSGSDAHGTPITLKAKEQGTTSDEVLRHYHGRFLEDWSTLGISFDLFTHTHTKNHEKHTQDFFTKFREQGDLSIKTTAQYFDETAKMFLPDRYVRGTCPKCAYERARGDQCEKCGTTLDAVDLLNPISTVSDTTPVLRDTDHFFFEMGKYQNEILEFIERQPHWRTAVKNFTLAMINEGLQSRAITRDIDWGISVPVEGWESKVIYVWFDAVIGYLSGSVEWAKNYAKSEDWERWWKNKDAKSYYFIGKDNVPFHTVIWPIELMAYDASLNLPYDVPANQFLNIEGEKLSTSRGGAVWLRESLEIYGADALRYYIATILPETKDSNFSGDELLLKNNGELVAAWGNLVNRVLGFAYPRYDGKVPATDKLQAEDEALLASIERGFETVAKEYQAVNLRDALKEAMTLVREVNKYLDVTAPWTAFKTDPVRAGVCVHVALLAIDSLKIMLAPVLPFSCERVHSMLGYTEKLFGEQRIVNHQEGENAPYQVLTYEPNDREKNGVDRWKMSELRAGTAFEKPTPLFSVIEGKTP